MLMPSLCSPPGFVPNGEITLPRTGQAKARPLRGGGSGSSAGCGSDAVSGAIGRRRGVGRRTRGRRHDGRGRDRCGRGGRRIRRRAAARAPTRRESRAPRPPPARAGRRRRARASGRRSAHAGLWRWPARSGVGRRHGRCRPSSRGRARSSRAPVAARYGRLDVRRTADERVADRTPESAPVAGVGRRGPSTCSRARSAPMSVSPACTVTLACDGAAGVDRGAGAAPLTTGAGG